MVQHISRKHENKKKKLRKSRMTKYSRRKPKKLLLDKTTSTSSFSSFLEFFTTSSLSLDSVSIVNEPWTTVSEPSWCYKPFEKDSKNSYVLNWQHNTTTMWLTQSVTFSSVSPDPTSSSGRPSLDISASKLTLTMLSDPGSFSDSLPITVYENKSFNPFEGIEGLTVWTVESMSSEKIILRETIKGFGEVIQVKYPWSPATYSGANSSSDYPSSVSLLRYMRPSGDTLTTLKSTQSSETLPYLSVDKKIISTYLGWMINCC